MAVQERFKNGLTFSIHPKIALAAVLGAEDGGESRIFG
jgi:hypothetical protein